jgi:hypothetical protein
MGPCHALHCTCWQGGEPGEEWNFAVCCNYVGTGAAALTLSPAKSQVIKAISVRISTYTSGGLTPVPRHAADSTVTGLQP